MTDATTPVRRGAGVAAAPPRAHGSSLVEHSRRLSAARLLGAALGEPWIRAGAWLAAALGRDREAVERRLRGWLLGGAAGWRIGRRVQFVGPAGRFSLGPGVTLYGETRLDANAPGGRVEIGAGTHVDVGCVLYGQGGLALGARCAVAAGVIIYSQSNHDARGDGTPVALQPVRYAAVAIGDGCWLGAGVRVLPGVTIGRGAQVGAGAVVTRDLAPGVVAVGVPARPLAPQARRALE